MVDYRFKPKTSREEYGWHFRRLPHFDGPERTQFLTFRLYDSMPQRLLDEWRVQATSDAQFRKRIEWYLDAGHGACWLRLREAAEIVRDALKFGHGKRYCLIAWVIMPNHVHALLTPYEGEHLPDILHSIKSFTALKANRALGRSGQFWQHESFDRYIRNCRHFAAVIRYIENNPVKAKLCERAEDWEFSSAYEERV